MQRYAILVPIFLGLTGVTLAATPAKEGGVPIGQVVAELTFKDTWYLSRTLGDLGEARAYVLLFTTTQCPLSRRVLPLFNELASQFRDRGVRFLAVNASPEDDIGDVAYQSLEFGVAVPFVKDMGGRCAAAVGATRVPQAVVLDAGRVLRYRGRVNDQYRLGGVRPAASRQDLSEAIEDVLAGRDVAVPETPADGCAIPSFESLEAEGPEPTYAKHIAPLIQKHCVECHRPNTAAPFALSSYESVARKARTIAEVVEEGRMPPWFAHPGIGRFTNARGLSSDERATILRWARGQKLPGDLTQIPPTPEPSQARWTIGTPDLVVTDDEEQQLPASGYLAYRFLVLPYKFEHDTWVQQVEVLPENPRVMHHAIVVAQAPGEKWPARPGKAQYLTGIVPGGDPLELNNGVGVLIPAGWELALEVHYVTTGKPETDRMSVGIRYARQNIRKQLRWFPVEQRAIRIPPGDGFYAARQVLPIPRDITLVEALVHMHLRGKDATITAVNGEGQAHPLLVIPNYSFDWQNTYRFADSVSAIKKGSKLVFDYHYDNSTFNPYNPDPTAEVVWGGQTHEEMFTCFLFYTDDAEALDIAVDPATGRPLSAVTEARDGQAQGPEKGSVIGSIKESTP